MDQHGKMSRKSCKDKKKKKVSQRKIYRITPFFFVKKSRNQENNSGRTYMKLLGVVKREGENDAEGI